MFRGDHDRTQTDTADIRNFAEVDDYAVTPTANRFKKTFLKQIRGVLIQTAIWVQDDSVAKTYFIDIYAELLNPKANIS